MARALHTALLLSSLAAAALACTTPEYGTCSCAKGVVECHDLSDGKQLQDALAYFAMTWYETISVEDSPLLTSLPPAAFGSATVRELKFFNTGLQRLGPSAVVGTPAASSIELLYIKRCPSYDALDTELVSSLTALTQLYVSSNAIPALTGALTSDTLAYIDLSDNGITEVAEDYFAGVSGLREVLLSFNGLSSAALAQQQTFSLGLYLSLGYNSLDQGVPDLEFTDAVPKQLILSGNGITEFREENYASLISQLAAASPDAYLLIDANPLACGCDMAWLASHPDAAVVTGGVCSSGRLVANLQPVDFLGC